MILYEFKRTRAYKCRWLINELGAPCEFKEIDLMAGEHLKEDFLKINPFGKVPALVDEDLHLHEASAICNYLADKYPEKGLIPAPYTKERAIYDKWIFFMANELECHLWSIEKNTWAYPEDKRSTLAIEMAKSDFLKAIKIVAAELMNSDFLVADKFGVADISLGYILRWARSHKLLDASPGLQSYLQSLIDRENYPSELFKK